MIKLYKRQSISLLRFLILFVRVWLQLVGWIFWIRLSEFLHFLSFQTEVLRPQRMEGGLGRLQPVADIDGGIGFAVGDGEPAWPVGVLQSYNSVAGGCSFLLPHVIEQLCTPIDSCEPASFESHLLNG